MRAFVAMRRCALEFGELPQKIEQLEAHFGSEMADIRAVLYILISDKNNQSG